MHPLLDLAGLTPEAKARRIYRSDLRFLDRSQQRGILSSELHARLSAL